MSAALLITSQHSHAQQASTPSRLTLHSFAAAFPGDGVNTQVKVGIDIAEPSLPIADSAGRVVENLVCDVSAIDLATGQTAATSSKAARYMGGLSLRSGVPVGEQTVMVDLSVALLLAPGRYELRADARSRTGNRFGSSALGFDVPAFPAGALQVSDLVLGSSGNPRAVSGSRLATSSIFGAPVWPFYPAIDHTFASTDDVRVYAEVARANPASAINASAEILDRAGRIVVQRTPTIAATGPAAIDTTLTLQWLASGSYRVRVTAMDGAHTATRDTELVVK
ncbi:MAG TPA: hypothetical protein VJN96_12730 [Vicinamibacterales bacterium]|nr:hypothetical protein [Vicinamibacterales bacterium]